MKRAAQASPSLAPSPSTPKRGRKRDEFVYQQFSQPFIPAGKKTEVVRCKHCTKTTSKAVSRIRAHLAECNSFRLAVPPTSYTSFMVGACISEEAILVAMYGEAYRLPQCLPDMPSLPSPPPAVAVAASPSRAVAASPSRAVAASPSSSASDDEEADDEVEIVSINTDVDEGKSDDEAQTESLPV